MPDFTFNMPGFNDNRGWICPRCERAYAPHVNECPHCQPVNIIQPNKPYRLVPVSPWTSPYEPTTGDLIRTDCSADNGWVTIHSLTWNDQSTVTLSGAAT